MLAPIRIGCTFQRMKMISASSSRPPMILPIRIHREIGIDRPFNTSNTVYTHNTNIAIKYEVFQRKVSYEQCTVYK